MITHMLTEYTDYLEKRIIEGTSTTAEEPSGILNSNVTVAKDSFTESAKDDEGNVTIRQPQNWKNKNKKHLPVWQR